MAEDQPRVAGFIAKGLREQTYAVDLARNGEEAVCYAAVNQYDLVILDVMRSVARAKNIRLECECAEEINFRGDQELIRRLVLNLLDNAIRYTSAGGHQIYRAAPPVAFIVHSCLDSYT